jgi:acyl carrier protein
MANDERSGAGGAEIERRVSEFLHGELLSPGAAVDRDANLLSGEVLDSVSVLRLVAFVQDAFHIGVQPSHFTIENFRSVAAIAGYVLRTLATPPAAPPAR